MSIEILYYDEQLIVVNKPTRLLTVAGRGPEKQDCVVARLRERFSWVREVHRLDWETSGVVALARTPDAHRIVMGQFQARTVGKRYEAVVAGVLEEESGTIELPLCVDWPNRPKQKVDHVEGRPSTTYWRRIEVMGDRSRVELTPHTGRSHQLRVHLLSLGHPILGDTLYAEPHQQQMAERMLLHSTLLVIDHPLSGERMSFESPAPF